jgi:pyruvate/2-oxoglutarate dehydrogenase complex dihydrolipoamide acyltransferase (E2) component
VATPILFPKIGFSMEEGTLAEWLLPDGAEVKEGQLLYVLESDKSAQEVESPATGVLKISVAAGTGDVIKVGDVLGEIG